MTIRRFWVVALFEVVALWLLWGIFSLTRWRHGQEVIFLFIEVEGLVLLALVVSSSLLLSLKRFFRRT